MSHRFQSIAVWRAKPTALSAAIAVGALTAVHGEDKILRSIFPIPIPIPHPDSSSEGTPIPDTKAGAAEKENMAMGRAPANAKDASLLLKLPRWACTAIVIDVARGVGIVEIQAQ